MTFPANQLASRVSEADGPFRLKSVDGANDSRVDYQFLAGLIAAGVVCATGSRSKLRYFQLTVDQQELERLATATRRAGKPSLPLDFLVRMCGDRKTTRRERVDVVRDGKIRAVFLHVHKGASTVDGYWEARRLGLS